MPFIADPKTSEWHGKTPPVKVEQVGPAWVIADAGGINRFGNG